MRKPGGIYNHIQDVDLARTSVLLPQGVYDPRWRDFSTSVDGGLAFGNIPLGKAGSLSYEAYAGYSHFDDDGGVARTLKTALPPAPIGEFNSSDSAFRTGFQLWWSTPVPGLRAGYSFTYVPDFEFEVTVNPPYGNGRMHQSLSIPVQQFSLEYLWKNWTFQAEYYLLSISQDTSAGGVKIGSSESASDSWYVGAAYRVNSWFEAGTYYSEYYADTGNRSGANMAVPADAYQRDLALSTRFDLTDWWIFKLEGHYYRGTALLQDNARNPVREKDDWWMLAAKTTFHF